MTKTKKKNILKTTGKRELKKRGGNEMPEKEYMKKWIKAAGIRAIKTMAQTAIATIGTGSMLSSVSWAAVLSTSLLAGILSLLTSVAGLPEVDE